MSGVAERQVSRWRELEALHAAVSGALEARLQAEHGLGMSEFEALEQLATCERRCRGADLPSVVHLSQSATSRLIARMEKEGLVERSLCQDDRRGIFITLTRAGRKRYEEAKPTHRAVLAELMPR